MTDYEKLLEEADTVGDSLEAMQLARRLAAALREVMAENACDACGGTGKPVSGLTCMCGGTGKMSVAAPVLRLAAVQASARAEAALADVEAMRAQIAEATGALQYARLAATWLVNHADRAHKYDRGYIDEVRRQIAQAASALDARGKGRTA